MTELDELKKIKKLLKLILMVLHPKPDDLEKYEEVV